MSLYVGTTTAANENGPVYNMFASAIDTNCISDNSMYSTSTVYAMNASPGILKVPPAWNAAGRQVYICGDQFIVDANGNGCIWRGYGTLSKWPINDDIYANFAYVDERGDTRYLPVVNTNCVPFRPKWEINVPSRGVGALANKCVYGFNLLANCVIPTGAMAPNVKNNTTITIPASVSRNGPIHIYYRSPFIEYCSINSHNVGNDYWRQSYYQWTWDPGAGYLMRLIAHDLYSNGAEIGTFATDWMIPYSGQRCETAVCGLPYGKGSNLDIWNGGYRPIVAAVNVSYTGYSRKFYPSVTSCNQKYVGQTQAVPSYPIISGVYMDPSCPPNVVDCEINSYGRDIITHSMYWASQHETNGITTIGVINNAPNDNVTISLDYVKVDMMDNSNWTGSYNNSLTCANPAVDAFLASPTGPNWNQVTLTRRNYNDVTSSSSSQQMLYCCNGSCYAYYNQLQQTVSHVDSYYGYTHAIDLDNETDSAGTPQWNGDGNIHFEVYGYCCCYY